MRKTEGRQRRTKETAASLQRTRQRYKDRNKKIKGEAERRSSGQKEESELR